jgi:hypothetical protein
MYILGSSCIYIAGLSPDEVIGFSIDLILPAALWP